MKSPRRAASGSRLPAVSTRSSPVLDVLVGETISSQAELFRRHQVRLVTIKRPEKSLLAGLLLPTDPDEPVNYRTLGLPKLDDPFRKDDVLVLFGAEGVESIAVGPVDRRPGQAEQEGVGQSVAHLAAEVTFLSPVGLVDQSDNVAAVVQHPFDLAELEDCGNDDLAYVLLKQPLQLSSALGLDQIRRVSSVEGA